MNFLDTFKKRKFTYALLLATGLTVLIVNNIFQLLTYMNQDKRIILLTILTFTVLMNYIAIYKKEIFR